ncbi:hypothetical protein NW767_008369 [Fusarium falciforme]|nr:hypothetical protein NW767_008369 [Fusarium falciforme]KAJ4260285.1 hypothetical protein NW757_002237 [Fusarium falciforme]
MACIQAKLGDLHRDAGRQAWQATSSLRRSRGASHPAALLQISFPAIEVQIMSQMSLPRTERRGEISRSLVQTTLGTFEGQHGERTSDKEREGIDGFPREKLGTMPNFSWCCFRTLLFR